VSNCGYGQRCGHHLAAIKRPKESHNRGTIADLNYQPAKQFAWQHWLIKGKTNKNLASERSTTFLARASNIRRAALTSLPLWQACVFSVARVRAVGGGEANLRLPDLSDVTFFGGIDGHRFLMAASSSVCSARFGRAMYMNLNNACRSIERARSSELIYETCKTYL